MRHKNKDIVISSLVHKTKKKHEKPREPVEMKTVIVPDDKMHTQFIVPVTKDSQEVINRYLSSRRYK